MKSEIFIKGSVFQQAVNTRHLPMVMQICARVPNKISLQSEPKLDFSHAAEYYAHVGQSSFTYIGGNSFELPYSDNYCEALMGGSCRNNRVVGPDNPAGWGFALTTDTTSILNPGPSRTWLTSRGPVKSQPTDDSILPDVL